jgi:hypothetical protein
LLVDRFGFKGAPWLADGRSFGAGAPRQIGKRRKGLVVISQVVSVSDQQLFVVVELCAAKQIPSTVWKAAHNEDRHTTFCDVNARYGPCLKSLKSLVHRVIVARQGWRSGRCFHIQGLELLNFGGRR